MKRALEGASTALTSSCSDCGADVDVAAFTVEMVARLNKLNKARGWPLLNVAETVICQPCWIQRREARSRADAIEFELDQACFAELVALAKAGKMADLRRRITMADEGFRVRYSDQLAYLLSNKKKTKERMTID